MAVTAPTRRRLSRNDILAVRMYCQVLHRSNTSSLYCRQRPEPRNLCSWKILTSGCARGSRYISDKLPVHPPISLVANSTSFPSAPCDWRFIACHTDLFLTLLITPLR